MKIEDLVVLMYSPNVCYTKVVEFRENKIKGLTVDIEKGVWSYRGLENLLINTVNISIGCSRCTLDSRYGVIGVYDRENINHLGNMVSNGIEATRDRFSLVDDD